MSKSWLLALESSTRHGGAALVHDGVVAGTVRLEEGLRHGRELMPAAASLLKDHGLAATDVDCIAASIGPGSYTGIRVGVIAAKAFAYAAGCAMVTVSSLAAMALTARMATNAGVGSHISVAQDARRDEVYAAVYRVTEDGVEPVVPDAARAPEEARDMIARLQVTDGQPILAGSAFTTYGPLFAGVGGKTAVAGAVDPGAVGLLAWRQFLQGDVADPMQVQPVYLRRDGESDWKHDHLITG